MNDMNEQPIELPTEPVYAILELFGHQVAAGSIVKVEDFGVVMIRLTVPPTDEMPAFTKDFSPSAIFSIAYVDKNVAIATARQINFRPVNIYVPELDDLQRIQKENQRMRQALAAIAGEQAKNFLPD